MVRLTCLLRRKQGLTPAEFHAHWRDVHGPLIARARAAVTSCATSNTRARSTTTPATTIPASTG